MPLHLSSCSFSFSPLYAESRVVIMEGRWCQKSAFLFFCTSPDLAISKIIEIASQFMRMMNSTSFPSEFPRFHGTETWCCHLVNVWIRLIDLCIFVPLVPFFESALQQPGCYQPVDRMVLQTGHPLPWIYTHTHTRMFVDEISSGRCGCVEPDRCHFTQLSPLITDRLEPVKTLIESTGIYGSSEKRETLPDTDD